MKILKDNTNKSKENQQETVQINCDFCDSELEITVEDTYIGFLGSRFVICPCCKKETMVEEYFKGIKLTKNNIKFPLHFRRTNKDGIGTGNGKAVEVKDADVERKIREAIKYFRSHRDESEWYVSYGDLYMHVIRLDGEGDYNIMVTKDFYETYIPFEEEDY